MPAMSGSSPGARLPIVFSECSIVFTAGPTTYEIGVHSEDAAFAMSTEHRRRSSGETTVMPVGLTQLQKLLIVALAEPMLRRDGVGVSELPSSGAAAGSTALPEAADPAEDVVEHREDVRRHLRRRVRRWQGARWWGTGPRAWFSRL